MKRKPVLIKDVLDRFLKEYKPKKESVKNKILNKWPEIVSQDAAAYSNPALIKNKILLVNVSNSAWLHHLTFTKYQILEKIQDIAGKDKIIDLRFKIGNRKN
ncbi:MAG: DUF721 domain-containing protein [PVC group bacterium]|nr:DUF721 domain-containing protein [PVC group bacterium]